MTTEPRVPTGDYRFRAADLVMRKSMAALPGIREEAERARAGEPIDAAAADALIEETERALEMASRALAEQQTEEN